MNKLGCKYSFILVQIRNESFQLTEDATAATGTLWAQACAAIEWIVVFVDQWQVLFATAVDKVSEQMGTYDRMSIIENYFRVTIIS